MSPKNLLYALCLSLMLGAAIAHADEALVSRQLTDAVRVELQAEPEPHFAIYGLDFLSQAQASDQISLTVHASTLENPPAIIGKTKVEKNRILFLPRFPLSSTVVYKLQLGEIVRQHLGETTLDENQLLFSLSSNRPRTANQLLAIYPSADVLPENLLKFYLHFAQPMNRGEAYRRIHLYEGEHLVDEPFLVLDEELWNTDQTRFTLFIHPGRIKRGVQPRELRGPPLNAGKNYRLRIDPQWTAANGQELETAFEKKFTVTAPVQEKVDPLSWKLQTPPAGSRQPVGLTFNAPLDHAMLERVLNVSFNDGSRIEGSVAIQEHETKWLFTPNQDWRIGAYQIEVAANLEDLCGNNLAAPFEVKMQTQASETPDSKIAIEFIVK